MGTYLTYGLFQFQLGEIHIKKKIQLQILAQIW